MNKSKIFYTIIFLFTLFTTNAQEAGFFLDDWTPKNAQIPDHTFVLKPEESVTVNINIDASQTLAKIPKYIYGNNAVTWDSGLPNNATAMTDLKNLNPHVLRWPGGNLSNNYFWNMSASNPPDDIPDDINTWYGQNTTWQLSVDEYYDLLDETNSTGIICINYSYARYGTGPNPVAKAAHMAAEWVRYDNGRSKFWEIGNENYGSWQAGYKIDVSNNQDGQPEYISGKLYGQHCKVFIDSMRAAAAAIGVDIKIGVVVYDAESSHDAISQVWNEGLMPEVGDLADYLAVHSYFTPYDENSSVKTILNSHTVPEEIMTALENVMAEAEKPMLPVAMTEWNIFAVGSMQQVSYINGMLAALALGEFVKNGYGLATRWDLVNGWSNGDDHGMFSVGGEPGVDPYNPRAVFFYMYYFQKYMGDYMVQSSVSGNNDVIVHASTFSSGETGFVIVNKGRTAEIANVNLNNYDEGIRFYTYTLTGGEDNGDFSRRVYINGHGTDEQGGGPDDYESVKALSSRTRDGIKIDLPPLSVVYALVDKKLPLSYDYSKVDTNAHVITIELSEEVLPFDSPSGFEVIANGITPLTITDIELDENKQYMVNLFVEQEIDNDDELTISYSGNTIMSLDSVELPAFSNENVDNLLPGDPLNIEFIVKNTESGEIIENCEIKFNNEIKYTDIDGKATFITVGDDYTVSLEKTHCNPLINQPVSISSDTTITFYLDSTDYEVTFQLEDAKISTNLSFVEITSGSQSQKTNSVGEASLYLNAGTHSVFFEKTNFTGFHSQYQISSDTIIKVKLERSHANIKFRLLNKNQPINKTLVIFGNDSLYTNSLGTCTFESIVIDSTYNYAANKEYYYQVSGNATVTTDTTIELELIKSVANVVFLITTESGTIKNASAILNNDTSDFDTEGYTKFFNINKNQKYGYSIFGDNFAEYADSIFVTNDTTIIIALIISNVDKIVEANEFNVYPNPAANILYLQSANKLDFVEIINITGVVIRRYNCDCKTYTIDVSNLPEGSYFIRTIQDSEKSLDIKHLIIRR